MADSDRPSQFIVEWSAAATRLLPSPRRALDVAMGRGRHAVPLAECGYRVFGVDLKFEAVRDAMARASKRGLMVRGWCADLTQVSLAIERFELVVVTRYLQRSLFPSLGEALVRGGIALYETFIEAQRQHGVGPTSPDHLLAPGELRARFDGYEVLFYEEVLAPDAVARIVARKPEFTASPK